jgi:hypothetical protein
MKFPENAFWKIAAALLAAEAIDSFEKNSGE